MIIGRGAESIIERNETVVVKTRISKGYRISEIDLSLRKFRTRREAKVMEKLTKIIDVPKLISVNDKQMTITMNYIDGEKLVDIFNLEYCSQIGKTIAKMHNANVIHGDLTTSNIIFSNDKIYLIDFGLSSFSIRVEDKAVDLHLLFQAIASKHYKLYEEAHEIILKSYLEESKEGKQILKRFLEVEKRGRNKH